MKQSELNEILTKHKRWLSDEEGGELADLRGVDLRGVDLRMADLRAADLRGVDLQGANLDNSCFPFWCGSEGMKIDRRLFLQLLAHVCAVEVDDEECQKVQEYLMPLAKESHVATWLFAGEGC